LRSDPAIVELRDYVQGSAESGWAAAFDFQSDARADAEAFFETSVEAAGEIATKVETHLEGIRATAGIFLDNLATWGQTVLSGALDVKLEAAASFWGHAEAGFLQRLGGEGEAEANAEIEYSLEARIAAAQSVEAAARRAAEHAENAFAQARASLQACRDDADELRAQAEATVDSAKAELREKAEALLQLAGELRARVEASGEAAVEEFRAAAEENASARVELEAELDAHAEANN
jgi:ElaB/YqjD/DUF883 family membrane-anchored ribosome-binding protein